MKAPRRNVIRALLWDKKVLDFSPVGDNVLIPIGACAFWEDEHLLPSLPLYASLLHRVQSLLSRVRVCPVYQQRLRVPGITCLFCLFLGGKTPPDETAKERDIFCLGFGNNTRGTHDSNRKGVKKCGVWCHTKDWGSLRRCLKWGR